MDRAESTSLNRRSLSTFTLEITIPPLILRDSVLTILFPGDLPAR